MTDTPCRQDPELFFDERHPGRVAQAKKVCLGCPLLEPCLQEALPYAVEGVWAATTTVERVAMRKRAGIVAQQIITNPYPRQARVA